MISSKEIPGFDGYTACTDGAIISHKRDRVRVVKQSKSSRGHNKVTLHLNGKPVTKLVYRIMLETFCGPIPDNIRIKHINCDKSDNRLENLKLYPTAVLVQRSQGGIYPSGFNNYSVFEMFNGTRYKLFAGSYYDCRDIHFDALVAIERGTFPQFMSGLNKPLTQNQ